MHPTIVFDASKSVNLWSLTIGKMVGQIVRSATFNYNALTYDTTFCTTMAGYSTWNVTYKAKLRQRIAEKVTRSDNGCLLWHGRLDKDGYGRISVQVGAKCKDATVHRVAYFLYNGVLDNDLQVSHLCHRKNCIEKDHLSLETAAVNNQRENCVRFKRCTTHKGYRNCVLR